MVYEDVLVFVTWLDEWAYGATTAAEYKLLTFKIYNEY